jgi:hypothetical protein
MASSAPTDIFTLQRGHEFAPVQLDISPAEVESYVRAVGDANDYGGTVPPLAVVALALQALQQQFELPDGTLHSGQEVEQLAVTRAGERLVLRGRIAQRSERQGVVLCTVEYDVARGDETVVRARSTIVTAAAS